jgi:hypothetical protein
LSHSTSPFWCNGFFQDRVSCQFNFNPKSICRCKITSGLKYIHIYL